MLKRLSIVSLGVFLLILAGLGLLRAQEAEEPKPAGEGVLLRWDFEKGEKIKYSFRSERDVDQAVGEMQRITMNHKESFWITLEVTDITEQGPYGMKCTFDAVKASFKMPMIGEFSYDSTEKGEEKKENEKPAPEEPKKGETEPRKGEEGAEEPKKELDPYSKAWSKLPGSTFTFKLSRRGEVSNVKGGDEIGKKLLEGLTVHPQITPHLAIIQQIFSNRGLKESLEGILFTVPEEKVSKGSTWQKEKEIGLKVCTLVMTRKYEVAEFGATKGRECAKIVGTATYKKIDKPGGSEDPMAAMMNLKVKEGSGKGNIRFAKEKGRVVKSDGSNHLLLESDPMPMPGAQPGVTMILKITIDSRFYLELLGKKDAFF
jgi:hypothetical protein